MRLNVLFQAQAKTNINNDSNSNFNDRLYKSPLPNNNEVKFYLSGPNKDSDKKANVEITKELQKEFAYWYRVF